MKKFFCVCFFCFFVSTQAFAELWYKPVLLTELNGSASIAGYPHLSRDGMTLYFGRRDPDAGNVRRLYTARRDPATDLFTNVIWISELVDSRNLYTPWVSDDDLRLYYGRYEGGTTRIRLRMAERTAISDPWVRTAVFDDIHVLGCNDVHPSLTADELTMFYRSDRGNAKDDTRIWMATRSAIGQQFTGARKVTELDMGVNVTGPCITPDGLTIYYSQLINGQHDLFRATRASTTDPFSNIEPLSVSTPDRTEISPYVTPDENELFFASEEGIWYTRRIPEPVIADIVTFPSVLHLNRVGGWITCYLQFPADANVLDVDLDSILLNDQVSPLKHTLEEEDTILVLTFPWRPVQAMLNPGMPELVLTGELIDGRPFKGTDIVRAILPPGHRRQHENYQNRNRNSKTEGPGRPPKPKSTK